MTDLRAEEDDMRTDAAAFSQPDITALAQIQPEIMKPRIYIHCPASSCAYANALFSACMSGRW
jgi:hypothetical protein